MTTTLTQEEETRNFQKLRSQIKEIPPDKKINKEGINRFFQKLGAALTTPLDYKQQLETGQLAIAAIPIVGIGGMIAAVATTVYTSTDTTAIIGLGSFAATLVAGYTAVRTALPPKKKATEKTKTGMEM